MTAEWKWCAAVADNDGRPPEVRRFTEAELADPKLPLELALAVLGDQAGYRSTSNDDGTVTWYWPRPAGDWWAVPRSLNLAAHQAIDAAVLEACRRNRGPASRGDAAEVLRYRLLLHRPIELLRDDDLNRIFEHERERGRGYPIGLDTASVEEALRREGFEVIRRFGDHRGNSGVLARTPTGRYVLAADVYGPFCLDVPEA